MSASTWAGLARGLVIGFVIGGLADSLLSLIWAVVAIVVVTVVHDDFLRQEARKARALGRKDGLTEAQALVRQQSGRWSA